MMKLLYLLTSLTVEEIYVNQDIPENSEEEENVHVNGNVKQNRWKHKEEGERRQDIDRGDRNKIMEEFQHHSHPLKENQQILYNIVNGQVAPDSVNVQNALHIGEQQSKDFADSLPEGFHSPIGKRITTMEVMKKALTVKGKPIYDMKALFARLLVVGQQRGIELKDVFDHELSPVPPSLIDEFGCLRKGDKMLHFPMLF
ncbi:unnamed protein product [Arctogadus glacialis]